MKAVKYLVNVFVLSNKNMYKDHCFLMNTYLIRELNIILLCYMKEKEVMKLHWEVCQWAGNEKQCIHKKLTPYNTKIVTICAYLEALEKKINYCKN